MFRISIILLLLSELLQLGINATIQNRIQQEQQQCCGCQCCVCKNICEPGSRSFFGALGNGAGAAARGGKGAMSTTQLENSPGTFQNFLPFVPPSGEPQALTEVSRPTTGVDSDIVPDLDNDGIPGTDSETFLITDPENNRKVTINKSLPAPVNEFAVDKFFRENNLRRPAPGQLIGRQGTSISENQESGPHPRANSNFGPDYDDDRNQVVTKKDTTGLNRMSRQGSSFDEIRENVANNNFDNDYDGSRSQIPTNQVVAKKDNTVTKPWMKKRVPEVRAESCTTSCTGPTDESCGCGGSADYDPYLKGTFSGMRAEAPWPPAQEPKGKGSHMLQQQGAKEYYDEVQHEGNGRTTFSPNSGKKQQSAELDFLDVSSENTCRLCGINNVQESMPLETQNRRAAASFAGKYTDITKSGPENPKMFAANNSLPQVNKIDDGSTDLQSHISDAASDQKIGDPETPRFLESSNLVNLTEKLTTLSTAQALPLVGDFRPQNQRLFPSIVVSPKNPDEPEISPPSLLALERRLNNDTSGSVVKPSSLAGVKTQRNRATMQVSTLAPMKQPSEDVDEVPFKDITKAQNFTQKSSVSTVIGNHTERGTYKPQRNLSSSGTADHTAPTRYRAPTDTSEFPDVRRKPGRNGPSGRASHHLTELEMQQMQDVYYGNQYSALHRDIPDSSNSRSSQNLQKHRKASRKLMNALGALTTPMPVEDTLVYPPVDYNRFLEEGIHPRKSIQTRRARLFYSDNFKRSKTPILDLL